MRLQVLFFGVLREVAGERQMEIENIKDTLMLQKHLESSFPKLSKYTYRLALNQEIIKGNPLLKDGDVVAVMPPFAGG